MGDAEDRFAIIAVLDRYAEVLDTRDWPGLADVFTSDVSMDFGEWRASGLEPVTAQIRSYLDGCGPSQHLLGNYRIVLKGDEATSRCYVRVMHFGKGDCEGQTYEMWGEYSDTLVRTPDGWRSAHRDARVTMQQGEIGLLGPG
jgi:hypothetical protein